MQSWDGSEVLSGITMKRKARVRETEVKRSGNHPGGGPTQLRV